MNVKKVFTIVFILLCWNGFTVCAQEWSSPEIEQMYQQGVTSLNRGNASEAVAIFQKVLPLEPGNTLVRKSLAQAYQVSGNYQNALLVLEPMFASGKADAECYRIAAQCYEGTKEDKKALKIIAEGIEKNPTSGLLYYQQGMLFKAQRNFENALKSWLDGIAADPDFHLNYHEAAIAYVQTDRVVWAIIYGEIFVNKEPNTKRGNETRLLLLDAYQKLFFTPSKSVTGERLLRTEAANFEEAVKKTYLGLFFVISDGITTENLVMLRSRFMVSWLNTYAGKYPFSLYAFHNELMTEGYFDVYNQWLFGKVENPQQYDTWASSFGEDMKAFEKWRLRKPLKMQASDNYNKDRNFKGLFSEMLNKSKR